MKNIGQAVILCGGKGTRLTSITKNIIPKSIIKIGKYPFLYYIFYQIENLGIQRIILCTGFLSEQIENEINEFNKKNNIQLEIIINRENKALGTAGALKYSYKLLQNKYSIIFNGDTFVNSNLNEFLFNHVKYNQNLSITSTFKFFTKDYGVIYLDKINNLNDFKEKKISFCKYVYSGIAIIDNKLINEIPDYEFLNLENYFFKKNKFLINVWKTNDQFIDIGTKKNYYKYYNFFNSLKLPYVL